MDVAQLAERWDVAPQVGSSKLLVHPSKMRPHGREARHRAATPDTLVRVQLRSPLRGRSTVGRLSLAQKTRVRFLLPQPVVEESPSGRAADFGSAYLGSIPSSSSKDCGQVA